MDLSRIASSVDVARLARSHVAQIGLGGGAQLAMNLARSGVRFFSLFDPDVVTEQNLVRQQFRHADIGRPKVEVVAEAIEAINPEASVSPFVCDFCTEGDLILGMTHGFMPLKPDIFLATTDHFPAQALVNQNSLSMSIPAVFAGLFAGGRGGEVAFVIPGETPCFRCLVRNRYAAHEAKGGGNAIDPPSDGATVFDDALIDVIAGHLVLGILTRGFGTTASARLIDSLDGRNYVRLKLDPDDRWHGRDVVREKLQVPTENDAFFAWSAAALRDPDGGQLPCPDCERYGRRPPAPDSLEASSTPLGP